ncbi:DUF5683 domain-containing protein [Phaeocystidibacter marisrubri]|uniref:DUF5683 domain-containing protein n=1 Tax=Phaeocystidibacter marisrubri TaxID=1577780 RepID=A0A6L3ZIV3_9FLAO|nr:DUF5683 domain-containing protein [Phaeocystidibacter marisrubri]KAB2817553.1 hypothetical protein F8C82_03905 [Phaeocystidibacter marisrubri]
MTAAFVLLLSFSGTAQVEEGETENDSIHELPNLEADPNLFRFGQSSDLEAPKTEVEEDTGHSPTKATLLSLIPGGGQIYNDKWWKVPIIYGGLATSGYFIYDNNQQLRFWTNIINQRLDSTQTDEYEGIYSDNQLFTIQNSYRRYRDLSIIITVAIYGLQILDANVDAHLYNFDVSDDISLHWEPTFVADPRLGAVYGASFRIRF